MIDEEDILKLQTIQEKFTPKATPELTHEEISFLLYIFPLLEKPYLISPNCNSNELKEIISALKRSVETIFKKFDTNNAIEKLLGKLLQKPQAPSAPTDKIQEQSDDIRNEYHNLLHTIVEEKCIILTNNFSIDKLAELEFVPYEYLFLITRFLPKNSLMLADTVLKYVKLKEEQLESVLSAKCTLQRDLLRKIEKDVLEKLCNTYPLSLIAEAEYYNMCKGNILKKYEPYEYYSEAKMHFKNPEHKAQVSKRLKDRILIEKTNQSALARDSGVSRPTIDSLSDPDNKQTFFEAKTIDALAAALHCPSEYLFCLSDFPNFTNQSDPTPLIKPISHCPMNEDFYKLAKRSGKISTNIIHKLTEAENLLYLEDFCKIEEQVNKLINQRKQEKKNKSKSKKKNSSKNNTNDKDL